MTSIISDRYALSRGHAVHETVERRLHEQRFVRKLVTGLAPHGRWTDDAGKATTLEQWCFEQHVAATRAAPIIDTWLRTGQNLAPHIIETAALDAQFEQPGAREAWGTPAHMVWFLANTAVERIIEHFRTVGVPGVSVAVNNSVTYHGPESRSKPATLREMEGVAPIPAFDRIPQTKQMELTEQYRDWGADDMPLADDVVLLGDDGTGRDLIAEQEHALLSMLEEQERSDDAARAAKAKAKKDRLVADATERHLERTSA